MARRTGRMDHGQTITREPIPTPATHEDVLEARHRDRRNGTRERPATDREMRDLPAAACRWRQLSATERDDLASEVRERIANRHGWHPPIWRLSPGLLARDAATVWRDMRSRIADVRDASAATDATEDADAPDPTDRTDAAACWAGDDLPAAATDWREVCEGVGIDPDTPEGVAVFAALSGYGSGAEIATVLGITDATARKRLQRGRESLAERWEDADALRDALADADAADAALADRPVMADARIIGGDPDDVADVGRWPINGATVGGDRVKLDSVRRTIRRLLDRMAATDYLPHAAALHREERTDADPVALDRADGYRPTDARTLPTASGPAALSRVVPERVVCRTRRPDYLPNGRTADPTPERRPRTITPEDAAAADAAWIAATGSRVSLRTDRTPQTEADRDAAAMRRVNAAALAAWRVSRPWDRRRRLSRLGGSTLS